MIASLYVNLLVVFSYSYPQETAKKVQNNLWKKEMVPKVQMKKHLRKKLSSE